jgi:hypothetical protein
MGWCTAELSIADKIGASFFLDFLDFLNFGGAISFVAFFVGPLRGLKIARLLVIGALQFCL